MDAQYKILSTMKAYVKSANSEEIKEVLISLKTDVENIITSLHVSTDLDKIRCQICKKQVVKLSKDKYCLQCFDMYID